MTKELVDHIENLDIRVNRLEKLAKVIGDYQNEIGRLEKINGEVIAICELAEQKVMLCRVALKKIQELIAKAKGE